MSGFKLTREELNQSKLFAAEKNYGSAAPSQIDCVYFAICCEIGTVKGCENCRYKKINPSKRIKCQH